MDRLRAIGAGVDGSAMLSVRDKGAAPLGRALPIEEAGAQGWNVLREDLPLPLAVLKVSVLRSNSRWMRTFAERAGVAIAPHGKTTMAPALFDLQLQDGAWGITLSTPHQIAAALDLGIRRIFVANQIVGRAAIRFLFDALDHYPDLDLYTLVDSIELVDQIEEAMRDRTPARRLNVLVEKGFDGGRTGCRTVAEAVEVAHRVAASPLLHLCGVEGFEGILRRADPEATLAALRTFLGSVVEVAQACDRAGLFDGPILLSAGGSAYFDLVVDSFSQASLSVDTTVLLRSGCYITHDSGMYTRAFEYLGERSPDILSEGGPSPALEVWAYVQSCPEPGRAIVSLGKRDISYDDMPVPERWFRPNGEQSMPKALPEGHRITALNDQHGYLSLPEGSPLQVGDMVGFGISHPCLTFDKWRLLHLVDDDYGIVGSVRTYF